MHQLQITWWVTHLHILAPGPLVGFKPTDVFYHQVFMPGLIIVRAVVLQLGWLAMNASGTTGSVRWYDTRTGHAVAARLIQFVVNGMAKQRCA